MDLQEADKITQLYGKYLEYMNSKMIRLFHSKIPKSLLPCPPEKIEEACNMMAEHCWKQGNHKAEMMFKEAATFLLLHVDDEEALLNASKNFQDPKFRKVVIESLKSEDITKIQE